jgi:hypothetical protein
LGDDRKVQGVTEIQIAPLPNPSPTAAESAPN